jgi:glutaredoxin
MIPYEEIFLEFQKQKVKYIIVGGIAINLHGFLRSTADMDILVDMTDENLGKIVRILKKQGYHVKQPVDPMGIADEETRHDWIHNKNMKAFNFYKENEYKEVDIIIESPVSYQEAKKNVLQLKIDSMKIPVISINDLIRMKSHAGREVDLKDIEQLKKIKKL